MRSFIITGFFSLFILGLSAQNTTGYMGSMNYFTGGVDFQLTQDYPLYKFNNPGFDTLLNVVLTDQEGNLVKPMSPFLESYRFTVSPWIEYNRIINRNMSIGLRYKYGSAGFMLAETRNFPAPVVKYRSQHIAVPFKFNIWYRRNLVHAPLGMYILFEPTYIFTSIDREPEHDLLGSGENVSQVAFIVGVGENLILNDRLVLNFSAKSRLPLLDTLLKPDDRGERAVYNSINSNHWLTAQLGIGFIF